MCFRGRMVHVVFSGAPELVQELTTDSPPSTAIILFYS